MQSLTLVSAAGGLEVLDFPVVGDRKLAAATGTHTNPATGGVWAAASLRCFPPGGKNGIPLYIWDGFMKTGSFAWQGSLPVSDGSIIEVLFPGCDAGDGLTLTLEFDR